MFLFKNREMFARSCKRSCIKGPKTRRAHSHPCLLNAATVILKSAQCSSKKKIPMIYIINSCVKKLPSDYNIHFVSYLRPFGSVVNNFANKVLFFIYIYIHIYFHFMFHFIFDLRIDNERTV